MKLMTILLTFLLLASCKNQDGILFEFDPRTLTENKITLSEIADKVFYIPIDNTVTLGGIYMYRFLDSSIYFSSKNTEIVEFNRGGIFNKKIGGLGRGPGEYHYSMYFDVDPQSGSLYNLDGNTIKVYDSDGKYAKSISLDKYDWRFDDVIFHNGNLYISEAIYSGVAKYSWLILDTNGAIISEKLNTIPPFKGGLSSGVGNYIFNGNVHYWEGYNDTVFSILPDLKYKASFLLKPGEHRYPRSPYKIDPSNLAVFQTFLNNHLDIFNIFETNSFIVIYYFYKRNTLLLFDKKNHKSFATYLESDRESSPGSNEDNGNFQRGIINDLDGGLNFQPEYYYTENNREFMIGLIYPFQLKEYVYSQEFQTYTPLYPADKKTLETLAGQLKDTDNPIVMLVRLKE